MMALQLRLQTGLYLLMFAIGMIASSMGPLLVPIGESLQVSVAQLGILVTISTTGFLAGSVTVSLLWARANPRRLLCLATVLLAGMCLAITLFHASFTLLLLLFFLRGIGQGLIHPSVNSLLTESSGERRMRALCISVALFGLGAFVAPVLVGLILDWGIPWYYLYLIIALFLVIPLLLVYPRRLYRGRPVVRERVHRQSEGESSPLRSSLFWLIIIGNLLLLGMQLSFAAWIPSFLVSVQGMSAVAASYFISVFWLAMLGGRILYSIALHRRDLSLALIFGSIGASIFALASLVVSPWLILAMTACVGLSLSFVSPAWMALGGTLFPKHTGLVISLVTASSSLGSIIAISSVGFAAEAIGLGLSIFLVPALGFAGFGVTVYLRYHFLKAHPESWKQQARR